MKKKGPEKPQAKLGKPSNVVVPFPGKDPVKRRSGAPPVIEGHTWFRFRLRNGFVGAVPMIDRDVDRVWRLFQEPDGFQMYAVFDTPARCIALNLRHMVASQFDGHPDHGLRGAILPVSEGVDLIFSNSPEIVHVDIEPDELTIGDIDDKGKGADLEEAEAEKLIQLANLIYYCDSSHEGSNYMVRLQDGWGSSIWLRLNDVALISMPRDYIE